MKKYRVLQVCSSASWGGMEMHVPLLSHGLRRRGHQIFVVCSPQTKIFTAALSKSLNVLPLRINGYFNPKAVHQLAQILRTFHINIIHCHYSKDLWTVVPAIKFSKKIPLILIKHIGTRFSKKDPFHKMIYKEVDHIIANSEVIRTNLLATHPISEEKVSVIHLGIDLSNFDPAKFDKNEIRRELGIEPNQLVIGIAGRLQKCKGYLEFIEMARRIAEFYPDTKFLLVGGPSRGEEREASEIVAKIKEVDLVDHSILTGFREDVPRLMRAMDIFVFPSHAEAYGLVVAEAMAMGLPVVSSNCDGVLDIVEDGSTGFLVFPRNVDQLTEAVCLLIENSAARRNFGLAARARIEKEFSFESMLDKVETLYHQLSMNYR